MSISKTQSQSSSLKIGKEVFSLNPSSIIELFEIDIGNVAFNKDQITYSELSGRTDIVFRFHNNVKLTTSSIFWNGVEYVAAPITAEGFEASVRGVLPTPRLTMSVSDEGIPYLALFKQKVFDLSYDLVGAKVTRIRTFAKFLDSENFYGEIPPDGFDPDPNAELGRDVFYINRKSIENKNVLEFELGSILDVEGVKLPRRIVLADTCPFIYRGEGCLYEYELRRNVIEHGASGSCELLDKAPPASDINDSPFSVLLSGAHLIDMGLYNSDMTYNKGDFVHLTYNNINYYYVAKTGNVTSSPPNDNYWIADLCSKRVIGCELRYGYGGASLKTGLQRTSGVLPYGGFICATRFS